MYKSLRISVLKRILEDSTLLRCNKINGVITLRSYSGSNDGYNVLPSKVTRIVPFSDFVSQRRNEAKRSVMVHLKSKMNCERLIAVCETFGNIKKFFYCDDGLARRFALIEMSDESSVQELYRCVTIDVKNIMTISSPYISVNFEDRDSKIEKKNTCPIHVFNSSSSVKNITDKNELENINESCIFWNWYNEEKINDLNLRLRFLVARQFESVLQFLCPLWEVNPFGGSVNGFGSCKSDLDLMAVLKNQNNSQLSFMTKDYRNIKEMEDKFFQLMTKIIESAPGCEHIIPIPKARVPIIRFFQKYVGLDCDFSINTPNAVSATEIFYIIGSLNKFVRPLAFIIKKWASELKLSKQNNFNRTSLITNFGLLTMVIFFLQQKASRLPNPLPPFQIFPLDLNNILLTKDQFNSSLKKIARNYNLDNNMQENILTNLVGDFFTYYSNFNYKMFGISVRTGKLVHNSKAAPLYIENPFNTSMNISKQVTRSEIDKLQLFCSIARDLIIENRYRVFNSEFFKEGFYKRKIQESTKQEVPTAANDGKSIIIGDVAKDIIPPKKPQYAPHKYLSMGEASQTTLRHLRWMLQKDILAQDIFLIGRPGSTRRQLAMKFLEMTDREVEYICLSRDTTEADLKQRREIKNGTAIYFDQSAVRAAIEGRVLILEGVEKAERNVLPILNNLLENREMHLEDGRFLVHASRYDGLLKKHGKEELDKWNLVRVNENFRVIALGLPVPKYSGNPLDPPLRSRFQARNIPHKLYEEQLMALKSIAPNADPGKLSQVLSCSYALISEEAVTLNLPDFPVDNTYMLATILHHFPNICPSKLLRRLYPYQSFLNREGRTAVESVCHTFQIPTRDITFNGNIEDVKISGNYTAQCTVNYGNNKAKFEVSCGTLLSDSPNSDYVPTNYQDSFLVDLLQSHLVSDFCLIGPKGCGKSATVLRLAGLLKYEVEQIILYQDITSRDLLQQRNTLANGDTIWQNSPLIQAALEGKLAVLDGIDRVHPSNLSVIYRLVQDREVQLYDGTRLLRHDRYDAIKEKFNLTDEDLKSSGTFRIHPSFRIVALAEPPKQGSSKGDWLTSEIISLFLFHEMRPLSNMEENKIIEKLYGKMDKNFEKISKFASFLNKSEDPILSSLSRSFSTRQLLRMAKRLHKYPKDDVFETVQKACLARFLPPLVKEALDKALEAHGINATIKDHEKITCTVNDSTVTVGKTTVPKYITSTNTKVPNVIFYDIPQHLILMEWLLQDFTLGEHLLLVGNQGVGKNKIVDRLLQLLNRPREYIQLHRDTTVQSLTLQPTIRNGVVIFEDSPLVQAVKNGHVLVIDEADKAPTHVTCILKTLVERGEMPLSDGRKIVRKGRAIAKQSNLIELHPDFRMIVLANRPGFPFLGNDFFEALGDLFSSHVVDNPSPEAEIDLLKFYGPEVSEGIILRLVKAFGELRTMSDKGLVQYPYSTREVVNIVKHLQQFPKEGLGTVVKNVFDFDEYSSSALETLIPVLHKYGIPIDANVNNVLLSKEIKLPSAKKIGYWVHNEVDASNIPLEIRHMKISSPHKLSVKHVVADMVEARSSTFTELQSYWSLPMAENDLVLALAVTKREDFLKDRIHVLTANPISLYVLSTITYRVNIFNIERFIPLLNYDRRFKFTLVPLASPMNEYILLHEGNTNFTCLINTEEGSLSNINLVSISEKLIEGYKNPVHADIKINSQLSNQNIVLLYESRKNKIMTLDFNKMILYGMEMPFKIVGLHVIANNKWLLQDIQNRKYVLMKKSSQDPVPKVLVPIVEKTENNLHIGTITGNTSKDLDSATLNNLVGEKISAPNRILFSNICYSTLVLGFPELEKSRNDVYCWFRRDSEQGMKGNSIFLNKLNQIITPVSSVTPSENMAQSVGGLSGFLEVVDLNRNSIRYIRVPKSKERSWYIDSFELGLFVAETSDSGLVTADRQGCLQFWEVGIAELQRSLDDWMKLIGYDKEKLQLTIKKDSGKDVLLPKHGKVDPMNAPHVGGNTWAGGTGGRDTAGLGGKGGPYRIDAGHDVHQISDYEKSQVPENVRVAARKMNRQVYQQRLNEINMSEYDHDLYKSFSNTVSKQVDALRIIIGNIQAKSKEREWTRHLTSGDLDDLKLIEGIAGEKTIYRRRTEKEPEPGTPLLKPKRLKLVVDVSASMYRFNSYDKRLQRIMEATILVMEAFYGHENKIKYDIIGHSGETFNLEFVSAENPPKNNKERLDVVKKMYAHSQFCLSGDHTLSATVNAIDTILKEDCDEAIVVVLSDANLDHYNISPKRFGQILTSSLDVNSFAIFIGSLGDQAARLTQNLPLGRAFVCLDLSQLPQILQEIFSYSLLYKS